MSSEPIQNEAVRRALDAAVDAALALRVVLHDQRCNGKRITVPEYRAGLAAVREIEYVLEPLRVSGHTRAYELALIDRGRDRRISDELAQIALEIA